MSSSQILEKNDENTNENIKMVLLVLEENDKSTNDNFDNNIINSAPTDSLLQKDEASLKKLSHDFSKIQFTSSSKKITIEPNSTNNLKPKFSFSSNNISNVWAPETDLTLYNNEYNINNLTYFEGNANYQDNSKGMPMNAFNNFPLIPLNDDSNPNLYYTQSVYQKPANGLQNPNSPIYANYNIYQPAAAYMQNNGSNYHNYQYITNNKPVDYFIHEENYSFGTMRPHFFSQTNIEEKKNFVNTSSAFKKNTPKKNSLVMRNNNFSSPNGGFDNRNENEIDFNADPQNLFEFCKDQLGSRRIQLFFEKATEEEKEKLFIKIENQLLFLIKDVFGNYVVQKMLEKGNQRIKEMVYEKMKNNVLDLTFNTYGCRVVQKALEVFHTEPLYQEKIIAELRSNVLKCIQNQNGNHVIQKCFETIKSAKLEFIITEVIENINNLAFHAYGCRVIQKILEYSDFEKTLPILDKLMENNKKLCECQFGNYIMQHIIEKGPSPQKEKVLQTVKAHFVEFSTNKFASNVAEKAVLFGPKEFKRELVHNLLKSINLSEFLKMMKDPYGNYVAQKLYGSVDDSGKKEFAVKLSQPEVVTELRKDNYGKHVLSCLEIQGCLHEKK